MLGSAASRRLGASRENRYGRSIGLQKVFGRSAAPTKAAKEMTNAQTRWREILVIEFLESASSCLLIQAQVGMPEIAPRRNPHFVCTGVGPFSTTATYATKATRNLQWREWITAQIPAWPHPNRVHTQQSICPNSHSRHDRQVAALDPHRTRQCSSPRHRAVWWWPQNPARNV